MAKVIVGRKIELARIQKAISSNVAELGIIYGRRRIGKSTLLKAVRAKKCFYFEAIKNYNLKQQVGHFLKQFAEQANLPPIKGETWEEAFDVITPFLLKGHVYVVFDELPWMANEKSMLVNLIKYYWDNKWKQNPGLKLILCGSIAQYMVHHVVHSEALHNRKTFEMKIRALSSWEASQFFPKRMSNYEKTMFLMTVGGVPKYLEQLNFKRSYLDNLREHFFQQDGFFVSEFESIFKEQFKASKTYEKIIRSLSVGQKSVSAIGKELNMSGGGFLEYFENLSYADFLKKNVAFDVQGKAKDKTVKFQLQDEFLIFYLKFIEPQKKIIDAGMGKSLPESLQNSIQVFLGQRFELFCFKNIRAILKALEISESDLIQFGPYFSQGPRSLTKKDGESGKGLQIDLLIVLKKKRIVIIECKFTQKPVGMSVIHDVEEKINHLHVPKTYSISPILLSASGATQAVKDADFFNNIVDLDLFYHGDLAKT